MSTAVIAFRVPQEVAAAVRKEARTNGQSVSAYVRAAIAAPNKNEAPTATVEASRKSAGQGRHGSA